MSARITTLGTLAGVALGLAVAAAMLRARESRYPAPASTERLLYLRSGRTADRLMLGFDAVAADLYWIRAIQHFGRDRKSSRTTGRFELLFPLLDLVTTLDPHFGIAYRHGAILLAINQPDGPARPDQAIALLEKGLRFNPERWQLAYDLGFIHYFYTADYGSAGRWFERAATLPGAPEWIAPLAATTLAKGGDRESARAMLLRLHESDQEYLRRAAERGLLQLRALDELDGLQALIEQHREEHLVYPESWLDLMQAGALTALPVDPYQVPYGYDPSTHRAGLSPDSPLAPLPATLSRQ